MIDFIRKRDGRLVPFEEGKITEAIVKAVRAVGGQDLDKAAGITRQVAGILEVLYKDGRVPTVENVQDLVEKILIENGHAKVAKAYILYRQQHDSLRQTRQFMKESIEAIDSYLTQEDWRVNENANMGYSLQGLNNHIAANITSNYWLNKIYPAYIADAHREGDFHIHDLGMLVGLLLRLGPQGPAAQRVYRRLRQGPERAGQAFPHRAGAGRQLLLHPAGRGGRRPGLCQLRYPARPLHPLRQSFLRRSQTGAAGIHLQHERPDPGRFPDPLHQHHHGFDAAEEHGGRGGGDRRRADGATYGEFQAEMDLFNRAFCEVMMEGDASGRIFSFPIPTYNIARTSTGTARASSRSGR